MKNGSPISQKREPFPQKGAPFLANASSFSEKHGPFFTNGSSLSQKRGLFSANGSPVSKKRAPFSANGSPVSQKRGPFSANGSFLFQKGGPKMENGSRFSASDQCFSASDQRFPGIDPPLQAHPQPNPIKNRRFTLTNTSSTSSKAAFTQAASPPSTNTGTLPKFGYSPIMSHVAALLKEASKLNREDRAELISSLLEDLDPRPHQVSDEEALQRFQDLKSGRIQGLSEVDFWKACGRT